MADGDKRVVVAADVGGTKVDIAAFGGGASAARRLRRERHASAGHDGIESLIEQFLAAAGVEVAAVSIAAAGPLRDGAIRTTNLPWVISAQVVGERLGGVPVYLWNDLEAAAAGVLELPADSFAPLIDGRPVDGHRALLAPGTGLGQSVLYWDGVAHRPYATEGGHVGFAPRDEEQIELLHFLRQRVASVSYERVLSGPGLANLFDFVSQVQGLPVGVQLAAAVTAGERGAAVGRAALAGACAASRAAVDLFYRILAARSGDLILSAMAVGGIDIAGGVVPRLLDLINRGEFARHLAGGGPFAEMLAQVRVRVVLADDVTLRGAASLAWRRLAEPA